MVNESKKFELPPEIGADHSIELAEEVDLEGPYPAYTLRPRDYSDSLKLKPDLIKENQIIIERKIDPNFQVGDRVDIFGFKENKVGAVIEKIEIVTEQNNEGSLVVSKKRGSYKPVEAKLFLKVIEQDEK